MKSAEQVTKSAEQDEAEAQKSLPETGIPSPAPAGSAEDGDRGRREVYGWVWRTSFHLGDSPPLFPHPHWVGVHVTADPQYRSEGRLRVGEEHCYFCCTLEGEGEFTDRRGSHRSVPGQAFVIKINDPHTSYSYPPDTRTPWRFLNFTFDGLASEVMVRTMTDRHGAGYTLGLKAPILRRLMAFGSSGQFHKIHKLSPAEGAALVMDLLTALTAAAEDTEDVSPEVTLVRRADQIIGERSVEGLRVVELAAELGVSREHLIRAFRRQMQQSPGQAIRAQKMLQSRFLLRETSMSVGEIASMVGYADVTNFIHAFRQDHGVTPQRFRGASSAPVTRPITKQPAARLLPSS